MKKAKEKFNYQVNAEKVGQTFGMTETASEKSAVEVAEQLLSNFLSDEEGAVTILKRRRDE